MTKKIPNDRFCAACGKPERKALTFKASTDGYRCEDCPEMWRIPDDPVWEGAGN